MRLFVNASGDKFYPVSDEPFSYERMAQLSRYGSIEQDAASRRARAARAITGLSTQALADAIGVQKATVTSTENFRQFPSWSYMAWFQMNHGVKTSYFVIGDQDGLSADIRDRLFAALLEIDEQSA